MNRIQILQNDRPILVMIAIFALICTVPIFAFQQGTQPPAQQPASVPNVSETKLKAVAKAYLQVLEIQNTYKPKIESAQNQQQAQQLQEGANQEMLEAIEAEKGVTVEEYSEIISAAQQNAQLRERLTRVIQEVQEEEEAEKETREPGR